MVVLLPGANNFHGQVLGGAFDMAQAVVQAGTHVFNGLFDLSAQGCFQLVDQSPVGFVECFFQCLAEAFIALALN